MKLSRLVAYRNHLESLLPIDTAPLAHDRLAPVLHRIETDDFQSPELTNQLKLDYTAVIDQLSQFEDTVVKIQAVIDQTVALLETSYFQESSVLYQQMMDHDTVTHVLDRRFALDEPTRNFVTARIRLNGDWQHAGMIVRPGREDWIDLLVGCDPLYLVDTDQDLLQPAVLRFNDQYQRRLRTYTVNERNTGAVLQQLPDSQFAFCLAYNFFNFKPLEVITQYLSELYHKIKPGGCLAFTFNDGDRAGAVELAERHYAFYTPGRMVYQHLRQLGFVVKQQYKIDAAVSWVEVQKPGVLSSLRGGQSLAQIHTKNS